MLKKGNELYKVVETASVRGHVKEIEGDKITVIWEVKGEEITEVENVESIGNDIFLTERELIRTFGPCLRELAPLKRTEVGVAPDYYGYPLKTGDYVIAMAGEPLYNKIEGEIVEIYKLSRNEYKTFLKIERKGNIVCENVDSINFSTSNRFTRL